MSFPISVKVPLGRNILYLPEELGKNIFKILLFYPFWKPVDALHTTRQKKPEWFDSISYNSLSEERRNSSSIWISMHVCIYIHITAYPLEVLILFRLIHTERDTVSICHGNAILMKSCRLFIEMSHASGSDNMSLFPEHCSNRFLW